MNLRDIHMLEGSEEPDGEEEFYAALQRSINCGLSWSTGSGGRQAMEAINAGYCMLGPVHTRDGFGQFIPGRDEVKSGTKGSFMYVAAMRGQEWADLIGAV